jgi:hypothetical protein
MAFGMVQWNCYDWTFAGTGFWNVVIFGLLVFHQDLLIQLTNHIDENQLIF